MGPQLVANHGHHRFGFKSSGKAVSQVARDCERVLWGECAFGNSQNIKLHGGAVAGLVLIDAVQISQQGFAGRRRGVHCFGNGLRVFANP